MEERAAKRLLHEDWWSFRGWGHNSSWLAYYVFLASQSAKESVSQFSFHIFFLWRRCDWTRMRLSSEIWNKHKWTWSNIWYHPLRSFWKNVSGIHSTWSRATWIKSKLRKSLWSVKRRRSSNHSCWKRNCATNSCRENRIKLLSRSVYCHVFVYRGAVYKIFLKNVKYILCYISRVPKRRGQLPLPLGGQGMSNLPKWNENFDNSRAFNSILVHACY